MDIRDLYLRGLKFRQLLEEELESYDTYDLPLRRRLWLWRHGFLSRSEYVYDLTDDRYRYYLTDFERFVRTPLINGEWNVALTNKLLFHWLMGRFEAHRMGVSGMVRDGRYLPLDSDGSPRGTRDEPPAVATEGLGANGAELSLRGRKTTDAAQRVLERLQSDGRLVLKWIKGGGGENVYLCSQTDDGIRVNGEPKTTAEFESLVEGLHEYLVCEFVEQSEFSSSVYPGTTNTLRVVTMYDETEAEAFVPIAILRVGTDRSGSMDNFSQGGLSAPIDVETGEMGKAVQLRTPTDLVRHAEHPSTGAQIEGVEIPEWPTIRDRLLGIAEENRQLPYVGWDLVLTDDAGGFKIIEGNSYPGMKSLQSHRPLLEDERVREFYRRHGVVRR